MQLYADGFASLPLREKTLIWHLYQAALAGRDIFIDQRHEDALAMRSVLEQIVAHPAGVDAATLTEIERYTKLFWLNNGALQQSHGAQVRAGLHSGGFCRGGEGRGARRRHLRDR